MLLTLPISSANGVSVGFFDALFTSTSCVCVTGLVVVDTGTAFSTFGHVVIILLIQIGGLGFMSVAMLYFMVLGKRVTLGTRLVIQESLNEDRIGGLVRMMRWVIFSALSIEAIGAILLSTRFIPIYGFGKGLWYGVFHSISAFCNAGFDLIGGYRNLMPFQYDPVVNLTICSLIIIGGLGFAVLQDVKQNGGNFKKLRLHSKLVIVFTAILLLGGTLIVLLVEWSNPATLGADEFLPEIAGGLLPVGDAAHGGLQYHRPGLAAAGNEDDLGHPHVHRRVSGLHRRRRQDLDHGGAVPQCAHGGARPHRDRGLPPHHQPRDHAARAGHRHDRSVCDTRSRVPEHPRTAGRVFGSCL